MHWTPGGEPPSIPAIAEQYVIHGVTTVTDFHSAPESYAPKRAWLANLSAPHVAFAARMSTPGGHGAMWADNHTTYKISTPEDAAVAMKTLAPYKPDLIKLFADGWRYGRKEENTSMDELTMKGMADAAHPLGLPVVAHVVTVDRAKKAAGAGVDVLVHAVQDGDADEELVQAMLSANMTYSPSLAVYEVTEAKKAYYDEEALAMADNRQKHSMYNLKLFSEAGIPVATGTDAGMPKTPHGSSTHREMELLVAGGLTPEQALVAFTTSIAAATADTMASEIGVLSPNPVMITDPRKIVEPGTDGGISLEGTIASLLSSVSMSMLSFAAFLLVIEQNHPLYSSFEINHLYISAFFGFFGSIIDSFLGATLENRGILGNSGVNFCSITLTVLLSLLFLSIS